MNDFEHKDEARLSRQEAAERLVDIAYALTAGGPLELSAGGRRIRVPVGNELRLERELRSKDDQVEFGLELTWSIPETQADAGSGLRSSDDGSGLLSSNDGSGLRSSDDEPASAAKRSRRQ